MSDLRLRELERAVSGGNLDARQALFLADRRAGFPNSRDPRKDPRPGDRLRRASGIWEVRWVRFDHTGADGERLLAVVSRRVLTPSGSKPKTLTLSGFQPANDATRTLYGRQWGARAMSWEVESRAELEGMCECGHGAGSHGTPTEFLWACLECRVEAWAGHDYLCTGFGAWRHSRNRASISVPSGPA